MQLLNLGIVRDNFYLLLFYSKKFLLEGGCVRLGNPEKEFQTFW